MFSMERTTSTSECKPRVPAAPSDMTTNRDYSQLPAGSEPMFFPPYTHSTVLPLTCYNVSLRQYCTALAEYMSKMRGRALPGVFPPKVHTAIFRQQSARWEDIARTYLDRCYYDTVRFLECAVEHAAGKHTAAKLMDKYIYPALGNSSEALDSKIVELLWPYQKAHPITTNGAYRVKMQSAIDGVKSSQDPRAHTRAGDAIMLRLPQASIAAAEALDQAEAYYDVCLSCPFMQRIQRRRPPH